MLNNLNSKAFSLIELITVIFIISVALAGMITLITRILVHARLIGSRLEASYLAQEGMELVRNIRDSNWIAGCNWDQGIGGGSFEIDYDDDYDDGGLFLWQNEGRYLAIKNGFYVYDSSGRQTKFKRKIDIEKKPGEDEIRFCTLVFWQEVGKNYEIKTCSRLYDWQRGFSLQ